MRRNLARLVGGTTRFLTRTEELRAPTHDTSIRIAWGDEGKDEGKWNDVNFFLAETLRSKYRPKDIVRLEFRAIPDTEADYAIEVEAVVHRPVRIYPVRVPVGGRAVARLASASSKPAPVEFVPGPVSGYDLSDRDLDLVVRFNRLPLRSRIRFFQKHVAPLCK